MLGPGETERLEELDWRGLVDELVGAQFAARAGGRAVLARRPDGACIFLGAQDQCRIHEHFGGDQKPLMCRMFPFGFLPVGDQVAVDVSFACRSVSEGTGRPLKVRTPEWAKLLGAVGSDTRHRFSQKYDVDGSLLWELEHHLLELLSHPSLSMLERIRAVSEFLRLAVTSDPRTEAARQLRRVMATGVLDLARNRDSAPDERMDKTQRAIFFHLLFLLLNPTPREVSDLSGKARQKEVRRRVQAAEGYKFGGAHPWVDNREMSVDYQGIAAIEPGYLLEEGGEILSARYLEAKIVGQRFMREGDQELAFIEAVPRLLLMFPMLVWAAKAVAAEQGTSRIEEAHVRHALRLLDRSFGEVSLSQLPAKQRKAWRFVLLETDLPNVASIEMLAPSGGEN